MAFDYAYGIRLDSEGSATAIGTAADDVRILPEVSPGLRGRPAIVATAHGSQLDGRIPYSSYDFVLEAILAYGTPETPLDVYTNRSTLISRMTSHLGPVWLSRTAPFQGTVEIPIRVLRAPRTTNPRHRIAFPCRTLEPFWRDVLLTFNSVSMTSGITNTGDAPMADGLISFAGTNGVQRLTDITVGGSGSWIELDANTTGTPIVVDTGRGTTQQGGSDVDSVMTSADPWLLEINPGVNAYSLSGGGTVTFTGREKWL